MSEHVLSILVKALGATQASRELKKVDSALGNIGGTAKRGGLATAGANLARFGAIGIAGIGAAVTTGVRDLATLEDATTQVDGAIKTLGLTGQVTSKQVADWANEIEANVQAAFDDKDITSATATLLRFGKVTPKNLKPAMVVMTDLAAKTGDVDSAASLLAKALADPAKAAGKLARVGVVLTKSQQDQIKALVKAGKVSQAQTVLLDALAESTKGAAAASAGPYRDALNQLSDASEDARKALAVGFLPVIKRVADFLQKKLADPKTITDLEGLGTGLADAFSKVIDFVGKVPWDAVADAMKIAGAGGKALLDAFSSMPPWVQTAVLTGWGLNKLSGGAITGIVGELGKGLIKGVLGINAGVVNVRGATVTGAGGGIAGAAGKGGGLVSTVGKVFLVGAAVGVFAELKGILDDQSAANKQGEAALTGQTTGFVKVAGISEMRNSLAGIEAEEKRLNNSWDADGFAFRTNIDGVRDAVDQQKAVLKAGIAAAEARQGSIQGAIGNITPELSRLDSDFTGAIGNVTPEISRLGARVVGAVGNLTPQLSRLGSNVTGAIGNVTPQISRLSGKMDATTGAVGAVRAAIAAKDLSVAIKNVIPIALNAVISNRENSKVNASFSRAYSTGKFAN